MKETGNPWGDPRPELVQDSLLWKRLLGMALERHGEYLASLLRVMRRCRTRIKPRSSDGRLYMAGEVDRGGIGWQSLEEWEAEKRELLAPHARAIAGMLRELGDASQ